MFQFPMENEPDLKKYSDKYVINHPVIYNGSFSLSKTGDTFLDMRNWGKGIVFVKGHEVICGTNYYGYLNFPLSPWKGYKADWTFDIKDIYEKNPSMNREGNPLVLGMSCALWCDYNVTESMIDKRIFPRIFALAEQMWHKGEYLPFDTFYKIVKEKKPFFENMGYEFGPGLRSEIPKNYSWD